ncbi:MAG: hypothetical protein COC24_012675 [Alphaproteobacteria bacterium]|nr:hypothetical protein [Alphaproteobacteria bacterium]
MSQNKPKVKVKNLTETLGEKQKLPYAVNRRFSTAPMIDRMGKKSIHLIYKNN